MLVVQENYASYCLLVWDCNLATELKSKASGDLTLSQDASLSVDRCQESNLAIELNFVLVRLHFKDCSLVKLEKSLLRLKVNSLDYSWFWFDCMLACHTDLHMEIEKLECYSWVIKPIFDHF